eukprot:scaffold48113_cov66-Cyclotella_meneghiniana.AAC.1
MTMWDVIRATLQEHHQRIVKANEAKRRLDEAVIANRKEEASEHQGGAVEGEGAAINNDSSANHDLKAPAGIGVRGPDYPSAAVSFSTEVTTNEPKDAAAHLKDPPSHHVVTMATSTTCLTANSESTANNDEGPDLVTTWNTVKSSSRSRNHRNKKDEESNLVSTLRTTLTVKSSNADASVPSQLKATDDVISAREPDSSNVKSFHLSNQNKKDGESVHDLNASKPEKPVAKNTLQDQGVNGRPLSAPNDSSHLSPLHCFIRQHCLEYVIASSPNTKRLKPVHVGMVGLQCVFCKNEEERAAASVSFPGSVDKIISSVLMWLYRHVPKCQHIPKDIKKKVKKFRESEINSGLPYIIETARETGLVDTNEGIYVQDSGMVSSAVEPMKGDPADDQRGAASSDARVNADPDVLSSQGGELDIATIAPDKKENPLVVSGTSLIGVQDRRRNANMKTDASYVKTKSGKHKRLCKIAGCEKQGRRYRDDMCRHHYQIMTGEIQPWNPKRKREEYE